MTRWKKDTTEFEMALGRNDNRDGSQTWVCRVPKAVVESLGSPRTIVFKIGKSDVYVRPGKKQ